MKKVLITVMILIIAAALGIGGAYAYNRITEICGREIEAAISEAESYVAEGDYYNAICTYDQSMKYDLHKSLSKRRKETFRVFANQLIDSTYDLIREYNYVDAVEILKAAAMVDNEDYPEFTNLYKACREFQNYVVYTGEITHIMFRPVIAYTDRAFVGDDMQDFMKNTFVTAEEFKRALEKFYENGYVLIDINNLYGVDDEGIVYQKELYMPQGKKPLVLSIDDLNYYDYMRKYGMVTGMEVGGDGKTVVSYTETQDGRVFSDDKDAVPIVDKFVKEHPDFSWGYAKGTVALTGYSGALGYRTNETDAPDSEARIADAQRLANVMKNNGWSFACKGYGDINPAEMSAEDFYADIDRWIGEVEPIVGKTDIYMYPTGEQMDDSDEKFQYMLKQDFHLFCGLDENPVFSVCPQYAFMQRRVVNGTALEHNWMNNLLDFSGVADGSIRGSKTAEKEE